MTIESGHSRGSSGLFEGVRRRLFPTLPELKADLEKVTTEISEYVARVAGATAREKEASDRFVREYDGASRVEFHNREEALFLLRGRLEKLKSRRDFLKAEIQRREAAAVLRHGSGTRH